MLTTYLAYLLVVSYFVIERSLRKGQQALNLQTTEFDRGSQRLFGMAGMITLATLLLAPILNRYHVGHFGDRAYIGWIGIAMMVTGLTIRYWAAKILGEFYTRTLRVIEGQQLIERSLYKVIRHPGYLGNFLGGVGAGLATINWIAVAVIAVIGFIIYPYRIHAEEDMLKTTFKDQYQAYMQRTWRLLPLIY